MPREVEITRIWPELDPLPVAVTNVEADVVLEGDVVLDTFGALDDSAESNPAAESATIPSLLRGLLAAVQALLTDTELRAEPVPVEEESAAAILTALGDATDEAGDPTVIGLLKQVIVKLGDVETAIGS